MTHEEGRCVLLASVRDEVLLVVERSWIDHPVNLAVHTNRYGRPAPNTRKHIAAMIVRLVIGDVVRPLRL